MTVRKRNISNAEAYVGTLAWCIGSGTFLFHESGLVGLGKILSFRATAHWNLLIINAEIEEVAPGT